MNLIKDISQLMILGISVTAISVQASVTILPGSISFQTNLNSTVTVSILNGTGFSVPSQVPITVNGICAVQCAVEFWQAIIQIPVTFTTALTTPPIITTELQVVPNTLIAPAPRTNANVTLAVSNVSTTGFTYTINILFGSASACSPLCVPVVDEQDIIAALHAAQATAVSFAAYSVQ